MGPLGPLGPLGLLGLLGHGTNVLFICLRSPRCHSSPSKKHFNIIGKLALNGHVGVNGTADYIKSIAYTSTSIVTSATATGLQQTGSFLTGLGFPSGGLVTTDTLYYMNQYGTASYATVVTGVTFPTYNPTTGNALTQVPVYSFTSGFFDVPNFLDITRGQMIATDGLISEVIG